MPGNPSLPLYLAILLCLGAGGCSKQKSAEVSGHVVLAGQPLADGVVTFRPMQQTSGPDFSAIIVGGEYRVPIRVLPGEYAVDVRAWKKTGKKMKGQFGVEIDETVSAIPEKYWGPNTELSAKIVSGVNRFDFAIQP